MAATPAGFWRRSLAWALDWLLLSPLLFVVARPELRAVGVQYDVLRRQLEDWLSMQPLDADSALGLWLQLCARVLADRDLQASLEQATLRMCSGLGLALLLAIGLASVYFIAFEASRWQATPGKRLLDMRVVAVDGSPVSVKQAALRFFSGSLSWLSFNLGHALVLFRRDRRALHDLIAGTSVVRPAAGR